LHNYFFERPARIARRAAYRLKNYVVIQTWTGFGPAGWCILRL